MTDATVEPESERSNVRSRGRLAMTIVALAGIANVVVFQTFALLARQHWTFDVATSVAHYSSVVGVVGAVASLASGRGKLKYLATALAIIGFWPVWTNFGLGQADETSEPTLKVVCANVYTRNRDSDAVKQLLQEESPDVFVLIEADRFWVSVANEFQGEYPFPISRPQNDNFGIAIRSKYPLREIAIEKLAGTKTVTATAIIDWPGGESIRLFAAHPVPPKGESYWEDRNRQLAAIAELAAQSERPVLLVGDLNVTPWSPFFRDLKQNGRLVDTRRASFGFSTTWNTETPLIEIPIDHALVRGLDVVDHHIGRDVSSDHRPIVVSVALKKP